MTTPAWQPWSDDPVARETGISFDRTPAGPIHAPPGHFRVCAFHIDFDERPVCFVDVPTLEEAEAIRAALPQDSGGFNVDYGIVYAEDGTMHGTPPWA